MTGFTKKALALLLLLFVVAYAANGIIKGNFEFPEIMVVLMNLIVVPLLCQWVKKITPVRELRAIIAWVLSFITAIVGIIIAGAGSFGKLLELLILAYSVSQIAYNLWWHRLLQPEAK
jgi:hypothetical protein